MRILGIDPGLNNTGYSVIEKNGSRLNVIEAGVIKTKSGQRFEERLDKIFKGLSGLIKENRPEVAVLEKLYSHHRHPVTVSLMGHARGVVCLACNQAKVPIINYPATRIKKAIVGRGNASKMQMQRMVQTLFNLKKLPEPTDVADALALALAYVYIEQMPISHLKGRIQTDGHGCRGYKKSV